MNPYSLTPAFPAGAFVSYIFGSSAGSFVAVCFCSRILPLLLFHNDHDNDCRDNHRRDAADQHVQGFRILRDHPRCDHFAADRTLHDFLPCRKHGNCGRDLVGAGSVK